ncbi:twin-arginine translocation protein, TatB subunit [Methylobacterium sp. 4-46]|uniref:Sec-independent protein translocase protein TatB n=1 Tax=unclassified Methylobacterium TaxID=2615210 RepID=UPI000152D65F|nr:MULTISPECIES: Sec-independent protein translocase protein TatB [Methylobacterium]ACA16938.1 twin-arginine translocation protein, TatB subunit [Methylobacterium sp. 4-46]WFT82624.1 Sec-independent protein translocase protein TatB [Methylobacterium nodulans]
MFDMSWGEVMLIGGVALIVIGPKDLPRALRTVGQMTAKLRRMAGEFQAQFNEAMREAELDEVRREVEGINRSVSSASAPFNPIQSIRNEIRSAVEAPTPPAPPPSNEALAAATAQLQAESAASPAAETEAPAAEAEPPASEAEAPLPERRAAPETAPDAPPPPSSPPSTGQNP